MGISLALAGVLVMLLAVYDYGIRLCGVSAGPVESVRLDGDVVLGGLFPVHENGINGCGAFDKGGYQRLEAMVYALDRINNDDNLLPGIQIGAYILDTCSRDTYALEQTMEFVTSTITRIDLNAFTCPNGSVPAYQPPQPTVGVVGAAGSPVSTMVANILRLFKIPQVSYASTSPELSDKSRYDYFLRVVPPDTYQAQAMLDIVTALGWTYVSTVASAGNYGENGISTFRNLSRSTDICLTVMEVIPRDATDGTFDKLVKYLSTIEHARGVVTFASETDIRRLLAAVARANMTGHFIWIGSDDWGTKPNPVEGQEAVAEGSITLLPARIPDKGFDEYFTSLTPTNGSSRVWFQEYWERTFHCTFDVFETEKLDNPKLCTGEETFSDETYEQEGKISFVVDAVYAFAHALNRIQGELCNGSAGLCPEFMNVDGHSLLDILKNISFGGSTGTVRFNRDGDRPGSYQLYQFQKTESDDYRYVPIGTWVDKLSLNWTHVSWGGSDPDRIPESVCSLPCDINKGEKRKKRPGDECCWLCVNCESYQYLVDEWHCRNCTLGYQPRRDRRGCIEIPAEYLTWDSPWAIPPTLLAIIGIACTMFIIVIFVRFNNTPIIRASGRELCYVLLFGILATYMAVFTLIARPSTLTCCLRRMMLGLSVVISFSALYTKTNRVYRIFNSGKRSVRRPKYTSPRSQMVICFGLVSVQLVGATLWLAIDPPQAIKTFPSWHQAILECAVTDLSLVLSLSYAMVLIVMCTVYAFKTRKMPENFNEAKFIAFAMYTTCVVWVAFIPIYIGTSSTDYKIQQTLLCLCFIVSATVTLGCIFVPKIYIVMFAPQKNKKPSGTMMLNSRMRSTCGSIEGKPNGEMKAQTLSTSAAPVSNTTSSDFESRTPEEEATRF
ncbi:metabotropic glutamate receptor 4-like isoform X2 [Patiria miniata]|uniref:G-protein coupled receptors family 3 profile domain-containing protein n=1 Tax=Patiria miniata TaxID=46514 RepID=A0A913ZT60_PATMI|nr:metabotropic glutamate receptor 4-like isoform X2 [Patiria miniata]